MRLALADGVGQPGVRLDVKGQLRVQLGHLGSQLLVGEEPFGDQQFDDGMQDERIVVTHFLQVSQLGDELYFFHVYQSFRKSF